MDDLSLCKRIAEIEGKDIRVLDDNRLLAINKGWETSPLYQDFKPYNPLTDDALCFQLMVKHSIEVKPPLEGVTNNKTKVVWTVFNGQDDFDNYYLYDKSPNKAICLAIIEAHKESNND